MKIGGENSKKTMLAIGLAVVAVILTVRMFYSSFAQPAQQTAQAAPEIGTVAPTPNRKGQTRRPGPQPRKTAIPTTSLDPRLRLSALTETETMQYDGTGRNIFKSNADEPAPRIPPQAASAFKAPPVQPRSIQETQAVLPPTPIPLKFFGFASQQGNKKVLLLSDGDVFVAQEGDIVQRRYKIMKINANNIEVQDVLSNNRQTIPLTAG